VGDIDEINNLTSPIGSSVKIPIFNEINSSKIEINYSYHFDS